LARQYAWCEEWSKLDKNIVQQEVFQAQNPKEQEEVQPCNNDTQGVTATGQMLATEVCPSKRTAAM
jgi:hypothetical protein